MMVFDRFVIAMGSVVDDATNVVENLAQRLPWHHLARPREDRAEGAPCRGTVRSGAQCKRRPVAGSSYCHQHRNQEKLNGRLFVVVGARDKATKITNDLSRKTRTAAVSATSRLATLNPKLRAQVLSGQQISGARQVARRMVESLSGGTNDVLENLAQRMPWHHPTRLMEDQAEGVRCRGTVKSGAQCKRRPVEGSAYCYQHRDQAKSDGRLIVVVGARDKAAMMTSDLSRKTWTAAVSATSRLRTLSPKLRAQVLSGERVSVVQVARRTVESLQAQKRWVISVIALAVVAAVSVAVVTLEDGGLDSLARFAREIIPRNPPAIERNPNAFGRQATPTDEENAAGLFTLDEPRAPGSDFAGAFVSGVEHLSADSSMLQIYVPAGVEGTYQAVVSSSEGLAYQCVILHHYSDRLYCIGPRLPDESQINLRIFKIDEVEGSQSLVFETNYTTGEFAPLPAPSPVVPTYGGAFTWPDRFDRVEIRKEQQSSAMLSPLSGLLGMALLLMYRLLRQQEHRLKRRLVENHEFGPLQ